MSKDSLRIAKLIGPVVNPTLPTPIEISAIADEYTAAPGEHVWRMKDVDDTVDIVLDVDANGTIVQKKRTPVGDVLLEFKNLNSKKEYVLVSEMLETPDAEALARRKESITNGLDKKEVKMIIDAIKTPHADYYPSNKVGNEGVVVSSGDDLYDVYLAAKHALEDRGDSFVSLTGTTVKENIDSYSKRNATTDNYDVNLRAKLTEWGIEIVKIFGAVSVLENETTSKLLDAKTFVLVAKNSRVTKGKPIAFCRRQIPANLAEQMGASVDNDQRALFVGEVPTLVEQGGVTTEVYGYSVLGFESVILCIKNPYGLVVADCNAIL